MQNRPEPKLPPTLEQLIEAAKQDVEKFKGIVAVYTKQNPAKAIIKQEEFKTKLALKEQRVTDLETMLENRTEAERQAELDERQAVLDAEAKREAEIQTRLEQARKEGFDQGLREQAKKEVNNKTQ